MNRIALAVAASLAVALGPPAVATAQASRVFLVRHAEKVDASRDPELSVTGIARAIALAEYLHDEPLDAVIVSQFQRTRMTAAPVARAHEAPIVEVAVQGNAASYAEAVAAAIDTFPRGATVLVVGHSNTLAPLIRRLGGRAIPDLCDGEYARLFVLDRREGGTGLVERSFGRADAAGADECHRTMRLDTPDPNPAPGDPVPMTAAASLHDLVGEWTGDNKLWFMPDAPVHESATTAAIRTVAGGRYLVIDYTWSHDGKAHDGHLVVRLAPDLDSADIAWVDSFHQAATIMRLAGETKSDSIITARGSYPAPTGPDWGWKIAVSAESRDRYVMRMWNITPGGEEALAVEAVYARK